MVPVFEEPCPRYAVRHTAAFPQRDQSLHCQPRVLIVAPMAGHFATHVAPYRAPRHHAQRLHDVYITDWKNARDVPLSARSRFGIDEYMDALIRFLRPH